MKKILALLLILTVVFSTISISAFAAGEEVGLTFDTESLYMTKTSVSGFIPRTFEARIKLDKDYEGVAGAIVGNIGIGSVCFYLDVRENGVPRVYARNLSGKVFEYWFTEIDLRTGEWVDLAISLTSGKKGYCYINGELKQTISWTSAEVSAGTYDKVAVPKNTGAYPYSANPGTPFAVGGSIAAGNPAYFRGEISSLRLYRNANTDADLAAGKGTKPSSGWSAEYNFAQNDSNAKPSKIEDLSTFDNDLYYNDIWIEEEPALDDYAYSFAVVGDTQIVNRDSPEQFAGIYDWILENSEKYNTKFVLGLGDITDDNTAEEWARAKTQIDRLDGYLPYSLIRGNHDRQTEFKKTFPFSEYGDNVSGSMEGDMLNTYQKFNVGGVKYMVLNLDVGASDEVLEWANQVVEDNPDRNVIVTTHAYLWQDGTPLTASHPDPANELAKKNDVYITGNSGPEMWDEFIKLHENIVLVLCGHIAYWAPRATQRQGDNGNTVTEMLINPQGRDSAEGGVGLVAMLHFSEDGKDVQVRYYSTVKKAWYMTANQYSLTLDMIESVVIAPEISLSNISFKVNLKGDDIKGKIIAALYDGEYNLSESIIYDAAETVDVAFTKNTADSKIKIMWWDGVDTIFPMTIPGVTSIETN